MAFLRFNRFIDISRAIAFAGFIGSACLAPSVASAQSISQPWTGHGHTPQHTANASAAAQPLNQIRWQMPVDLQPQYWGDDLLIHYGSALVTASNTVIVPVKTGALGGFRIEARNGSDGAVKWMLATDYVLPPHNWTPSCSPALTPKNRVYFPGAGGTVLFRDQADSTNGSTGRLAFYGLTNYTANPAPYSNNVMINTPITADRYGNIFFGFQVTGTNPLALKSGIACIGHDGIGTWISAATAAGGDTNITKVVHNCAPALANDHRTLYVAVSTGSFGSGYLIALDSRTLAPLARAQLKDPSSDYDASLPDDGTASPMIGPDGEVYFGVLEYPFGSNHSRGWLLHFNSTLSQTNLPGAFGWDQTPSVVPASVVPSYLGVSRYLLMSKYNNYAAIGGGDGVNKLAVLDPNTSMVEPATGTTVMKEVLTIAGVTPDAEYTNTFPNAVREWCINTAVVDPAGHCVLANSEDGKLYRWDFVSNTFTEVITLTPGIGEAYTPVLAGVDGTVYAINNSILFAVGQ
jgi:hypothetical protein